MTLPAVATKKQRLAYQYAMKHEYSILAVDPRLGKSLVGIAIQQTLNNNCLVICPSYLVSNWHKEICKWSKKNTLITVFKKGKDIYETFDSDFVVVSFDLAQKAPRLFEWADMILIDEAQHLASMSTKRTQYIHRQIFENSVPRVHELTGTILKNRVKEFYSPLAIMHYDPNGQKVEGAKDFGTFLKVNSHVIPGHKFLDRFTDEIEFADYFSFREEFKIKVRNKRGGQYYMQVPKWKGLRNIDELKKYLKNKYIRIKADKDDLPPISYKPILISDSNDHSLLAAFNSYFDGSGAVGISLDAKEIAKISKKIKDPTKLKLRLDKALKEKKLEYRRHVKSVRPDAKVEAAMKKVPFTIKYVEDLLCSVECVLVYSDHIAPIEAIAKHFNVTAITGKVSNKKRAQMANEFQGGKGTIICATIGSLKEGRDLFRSKDIVLNDPRWSPGDMWQMANRIRGLGQKDPRTVHLIQGSPQDAKIWESIQEKMDVINAAT